MRQTRDPITGLREKMVSSKLAEADELKRLELDIRKQVNGLLPIIRSLDNLPSEILPPTFAPSLHFALCGYVFISFFIFQVDVDVKRAKSDPEIDASELYNDVSIKHIIYKVQTNGRNVSFFK